MLEPGIVCSLLPPHCAEGAGGLPPCMGGTVSECSLYRERVQETTVNKCRNYRERMQNLSENYREQVQI